MTIASCSETYSHALSPAGTVRSPRPSRGPFTIYRVTERASGRQYVGLTCRSLPARSAAHVQQSRRPQNVHLGGLLAAIRAAEAAGQTFSEAFQVEEIASAQTADEAKVLERAWIDRLKTMFPDGFNLMPGGSSIGGPGNAKPVSLVLEDGTRREWPAIGHAIADCNKERSLRGLPLIQPGSAYARFVAGWTVAEALGLSTHSDGRAFRTAVRVGTRECHTLRDASTLTGVSIAVLRSRAHRRRGLSDADLAQDRHSSRRPKLFDSAIVWPTTGERLTASQFADRTCIPKATVIHRWHQAARLGLDFDDTQEISNFLQTGQDRRKILSLHLPDGTVWKGGHRELARRVLASEWEPERSRRLSEAGIRRRLRRLSPDQLSDPSHVAWAFGFQSSGTDDPDPAIFAPFPGSDEPVEEGSTA